MKALAGLVAIALGLGIAAWFVLGAMVNLAATAAGLLPRQYALYIGVALLILGLSIACLSSKRRKLGFLSFAAGALLCAYGSGHLG